MCVLGDMILFFSTVSSISAMISFPSEAHSVTVYEMLCINEDGLVLNYLCNLVKLAEKFIQHMHKFTWGAVTGQPGEAHNVSIQYAAQNQKNNNK